jgi:hypothetical protein
LDPREQLGPASASTYVIANPVAGGGKAARLARSFLAGNTELHFTEYAGHASVLAVQALTTGYRRIAVIGGDGTLHEVIQPLVGRVPRQFEIEFLGGGTSCDFIRRRHSLQPTDIIQIDCHDEFGKPLRSYGVNGSNIGFVADATFRYNHAGILTRLAKKVLRMQGCSLRRLAPWFRIVPSQYRFRWMEVRHSFCTSRMRSRSRRLGSEAACNSRTWCRMTMACSESFFSMPFELAIFSA